MKISRENLRQIIQEELKEVLQPKSKRFKDRRGRRAALC